MSVFFVFNGVLLLAGLGFEVLHHGFDERRGDFRDDGVAVGAQSSHAGGSPMSQRE